MARFLIVYRTSEGQTARIADYIAAVLRNSEHSVEVCDLVRRVPKQPLAEWDGVLVGGSVHLGKHAPQLKKFVSRHRDALQTHPAAFFSVSLSAAGGELQQQEAQRCLAEFLTETNWQPALTTSLAGAIRYQDYGLLKRLFMKTFIKRVGGETDTSKNYEYTNWEAVDRFATEFLRRVQAAPH